jgi:hypothetical protein
LIEESEALDLKHLMDGYESISRAFPKPEYQISIVHGRMRPADKDFEMQQFVQGKTNAPRGPNDRVHFTAGVNCRRSPFDPGLI